MRALAEELLLKETLDLLDIVRILGERPFPMTESIKDYFQEVENTKIKNKQIEEEKKRALEHHNEENQMPSDHHQHEETQDQKQQAS